MFMDLKQQNKLTWRIFIYYNNFAKLCFVSALYCLVLLFLFGIALLRNSRMIKEKPVKLKIESLIRGTGSYEPGCYYLYNILL